MGWVHTLVLADDETASVTSTASALGTSGPWPVGMVAHVSGEVYNPSDNQTLTAQVQTSRKSGGSARWTTRLTMTIPPGDVGAFELETIGLNFIRVLAACDGDGVSGVQLYLQRNAHLDTR